MSEFHAEASQATASEGLVHGPYAAARAGFGRKVTVESTNEPPPAQICYVTNLSIVN